MDVLQVHRLSPLAAHVAGHAPDEHPQQALDGVGEEQLAAEHLRRLSLVQDRRVEAPVVEVRHRRVIVSASASACEARLRRRLHRILLVHLLHSVLCALHQLRSVLPPRPVGVLHPLLHAHSDRVVARGHRDELLAQQHHLKLRLSRLRRVHIHPAVGDGGAGDGWDDVRQVGGVRRDDGDGGGRGADGRAVEVCEEGELVGVVRVQREGVVGGRVD